jgi:sec-independent protein translocase protein TatA
LKCTLKATNKGQYKKEVGALNLGMGEIALLIVILLALFGAKRLPEVGRAAGTAIREFKSALNDNSPSGSDNQKAESHRAEPHKAEGDGDRNA